MASLAHAHTCTHAYTRTRADTHAYAHMHAHICTHAYSRTCADMHTHERTFTHNTSLSCKERVNVTESEKQRRNPSSERRGTQPGVQPSLPQGVDTAASPRIPAPGSKVISGQISTLESGILSRLLVLPRDRDIPSLGSSFPPACG